MRSDTFRAWLAEQGCHIESHDRGRSGGHPDLIVRREGRVSRLPLGGTHEDLDAHTAQQVCSELGLDWSKVPGPAGRV